MNLLPRTLTARLVVTAVALVALVGVPVATSATLAMRGYLYDKLPAGSTTATAGITTNEGRGRELIWSPVCHP